VTELLWAVIALLVGLVGGAGIGIWWANNGVSSLVQRKAAEARLLIEEARSQQKEILLQAKDEALRIRNEAEAELRESRQSLQKQEERLQRKEENIDRKLEGIERRERLIQQRERQIEQLTQEAERLRRQQAQELERISQLSREEARSIILAEVDAKHAKMPLGASVNSNSKQKKRPIRLPEKSSDWQFNAVRVITLQK